MASIISPRIGRAIGTKGGKLILAMQRRLIGTRALVARVFAKHRLVSGGMAAYRCGDGLWSYRCRIFHARQHIRRGRA